MPLMSAITVERDGCRRRPRAPSVPIAVERDGHMPVEYPEGADGLMGVVLMPFLFEGAHSCADWFVDRDNGYHLDLIQTDHRAI